MVKRNFFKIKRRSQASLGASIYKPKKKTGKPYVKVGLVISFLLFGLVIFLGGAGILYLHVTPAEIVPSTTTANITANGVSTVVIPVQVKNALTVPMVGTKIDVSTNLGKVKNNTCKTNKTGYCVVEFVPHKSMQEKEAEIKLSAGNTKNTIHVKMLPDFPKKIILESSLEKLPANGYSSAIITIVVKDDIDGTVPDNTLLSLSLDPSEKGKLSSSSCYTIAGQCTVSFTSSLHSGKVKISAKSYGVTSSKIITITELPAKYLKLETANSSVIADGKSTTVITTTVTNELNNPVTDGTVAFTANSGSLLAPTCKTGSNGECHVTYKASASAGTAKITAKFGNNLTSSKSITLVPIAVIRAKIKLNKNVGDPIIPGFVQSMKYLKTEMAEVTLTNTGSGEFKGSVKLEIPGWSSVETESVTISAGTSWVRDMSPPLNSKALSNLNTAQVNYKLTLTDNKGSDVLEQTASSTIVPHNTMIWGTTYDPIISAWVTPNTNEIHQLISDAAGYTPWNSMPGYQQIGSTSKEEITYYQFKAIYDALQAKGMKYVNAPESFSGTQTVYTPSQSLGVNGGNCIDGSLVFASAFSSMGMQPVLALTPTHAFVCVATWSNSNKIMCVETTMIGSGKSFDEAYMSAASTYTQHSTYGTLSMIDVNHYLSNGVKSLPS